MTGEAGCSNGEDCARTIVAEDMNESAPHANAKTRSHVVRLKDICSSLPRVGLQVKGPLFGPFVRYIWRQLCHRQMNFRPSSRGSAILPSIGYIGCPDFED